MKRNSKFAKVMEVLSRSYGAPAVANKKNTSELFLMVYSLGYFPHRGADSYRTQARECAEVARMNEPFTL